MHKIEIYTQGEAFYPITAQVQEILARNSLDSGILYLFSPHTSCALTINEGFENSAKEDMQNFLRYLAHPQLPFITHRSEGDDDSPSHMKSILLSNSLQLPIERGSIFLGQFQEIYLAEFRQGPKKRTIYIKMLSDLLQS